MCRTGKSPRRRAPLADYFDGDALPYDPDTEDPGQVPIGEYWQWEAERRAEFVAEHQRPSITVELLRLLPLGRMKEAVLAEWNDPFSFGPAESRLDAGRGLSNGFLSRVADTYRAALAAGRPPLVVIAEMENASKAAASKWVARARREGLLGYPTRPGRAGFSEEESPWRASSRPPGGRPKRPSPPRRGSR